MFRIKSHVDFQGLHAGILLPAWGLLFLSIICSSASAQDSIHIFRIDSIDFPRITANAVFYGQSKSPSIESGYVLENGIRRELESVQCGPHKIPRRLSCAVSIDISGSMQSQLSIFHTYLSYAKDMAGVIASEGIATRSDIAVHCGSDMPILVRDFTLCDSASISYFQILSPLTHFPGNNFKEHLLNPLIGLLPVSARGKYQRVAVLITDGIGDFNEYQQALDFCTASQITFYVVFTLNSLRASTSAMNAFERLAEETGGKAYRIGNEKSAELGKRVGAEIFNLPVCRISWISEQNCDSVREVQLIAADDIKSNIASYILPQSSGIEFSLSRSYLALGAVPPRKTVSRSVWIIARDRDVLLQDVRTTDPRSTAKLPGIELPYLLIKGDSLRLDILYTPSDSGMVFWDVEVVTDSCRLVSVLAVSGGYPGMRSHIQTLTLLVPDGGEHFTAGDKILMQWKGVPHSVPVKLDFSSDGGGSWSEVSPASTHGKYEWITPDLESDSCLIRASQLSSDSLFIVYNHQLEVQQAVFSPDGLLVATYSYSQEGVRVHNVQTGRQLYSLSTPPIFHLLGFSSNGETLYGSGDSLYVWNTISGALEAIYPYSAFAITADGRNLISSQRVDNSTSAYTVLDGSSLAVVDSFVSFCLGGISDAAVGGSVIAMECKDGYLQLFHLNNHSNDYNVQMFGKAISAGHVFSSSFNKNETKIAVLGKENFNDEIRIWDLSAKKMVDTVAVSLKNGFINEVFFVSDTVVAFVTGDVVEIVNLVDDSRRVLHTQDDITCANLGPGNNHIVLGHNDGSTEIRSLSLDPLQVDISDSLWSIHYPYLNSIRINLGQIELGDYKDSLVKNVVQNIGKTAVTIDEVELLNGETGFGLPGSQEGIEVLPSGYSDVHVEFFAEALGLHQDTVRVRYQNRYAQDFVVEATVVPSAMEPIRNSIDFGQVRLGDRVDTSVAVSINRSSIPLPIDSVVVREWSNISQFSLNTSYVSQLASDEVLTITIEFASHLAGLSNAHLLIYYNSKMRPAVIPLIGEGLPGVVRCPDTSTNVGEMLSLPLYLDVNPDFLAKQGARRYIATLKFNNSLLIPRWNHSFSKNPSTQGQVEIEGIWSQQSTALAVLPFLVLLGDTNYTAVTIDSFYWLSAAGDTLNVKVETVDGSVEVLGLCPGRYISTSPASKFGILSLSPNPAQEEIRFNLGVVESGITYIEITDNAGRLVEVIWQDDLRPGEYEISISCNSMPSGKYFLFAKSPTQIDVREVVILH